jgi:hypothetical protein
MKIGIKTLAVLLLAGLFASSCATASRLDTEYEEETVRIEQMSPEEKAEFQKAKHYRERMEWDEFVGGGED